MKQILTARECARLNKRMNFGDVVQQYKQHPCIGLDRPLLPVVCVTFCVDSDHTEKVWVLVQPRNRASAKIVRRYMLDTLPAWPDFDDMPDFDGFVADEGIWYEITRANGLINWTGRPS